MAIIKNKLGRLRYYPFHAVDQEALEMLREATCTRPRSWKNSSFQTVQFLECFGDLTGEKITTDVLTSSKIFPIFGRFCGALADPSFSTFSPKKRLNTCRELASVIQAVRTKANVSIPFFWDYTLLKQYEENWKRNPIPFDTAKIAYWTGWPVHNRHGEVTYLRLPSIWNSHGEAFTNMIHGGIRHYSEGTTADPHYLFNRMFSFLSENSEKWPADTFQDPNRLYDYFYEFIENEFNLLDEEDPNLPSLKKNWNKFIGMIYRMFIHSRKWATPYRHLPLSDAKAISGHHTHIRTTVDGIEVREKLITPIPLHLTERSAVQKLILQIREDVRVIRAWAAEQSLAVVKRFQNRKLLAETADCLNPDDRNFYSSNFINNVAALFNKTTYNVDLSKIVPTAKRLNESAIGAIELTQAIGIPNTRDVYPFQCMLIMEHPSITNSFLERFDLYDKHGDLTGFVSEGGKSYLSCELESRLISGLKGRKGMAKGRQKYELTATAAQVMLDVITITTPARDYLRAIGDENWKKLFIASPISINYPIISKIPKWNKTSLKSQHSWLIPLFHAHTELRGAALVKYLSNISPSAIRASRCVEEYLDTGSTRLMSEKLGHDMEDSALLESYVPRVLVNFIESNGVRTVQKVAICHALRDSPFLMEGAGFNTIEELGSFIRNHTLSDIPEYLARPDYRSHETVEKFEEEILVRLSVGSLTALLSLEAAVSQAKDSRLVTLYASRWAKLTGLIVADIQQGINSSLKEKLQTARNYVDPSRMENLIYE
ncbi:hypothetical protein T3H00_29470 [Pseudomonas fluorescens]|uniref:hypothetical protein n=1 Tax=Pseudomonas fluorescens TaxID=294 RepID=UPI002ACADE37|nr:hypothetical protein [Pseudomonas fluorescens]MDZ5436771.1 hypothetical protein [Pseudomonas fluorescens]